MQKLSARLRGQILITTLIILMLVSLTVVVITATVAKNNRQVFNNLEYEKSYNYAESRLIQATDVLSNPDFDLFSLGTTVGQQQINALSCESLVGNTKYYCAYDEEDKSRRTLLTIEETNKVVAYDLGADEYFDIILFKTDTDAGYRNPVQISWLGDTALELTLVYQDANNRLQNIVEVVDPTTGSNQIFDSKGKPSSGFLTTGRVVANGSEVTVNLQNVDTTKTGANAKLRYLRVKVVNKQAGATISIQPVQDDDLPNQVRKLEALSYTKSEIESSAPVVSTQLPLSPPVTPNIVDALNFHSIRQPMCGNGVVEGSEICDDGNTIDGDSCPNSCGGCKISSTGAVDASGYPFNDNVGIGSVQGLDYGDSFQGKTKEQAKAIIDKTDIVIVSGASILTQRETLDYVIDKGKIGVVHYGDGMDCWNGHVHYYRYGLFSSPNCTWFYPSYGVVAGALKLNTTAYTPPGLKFEANERFMQELTPPWQTNALFDNLWYRTPNERYPWRPGSIGGNLNFPDLNNVLHPLLGSKVNGCIETQYEAIPEDSYYTLPGCGRVPFYRGIPCQTSYGPVDPNFSDGSYAGYVSCQPVPQTQCLLTYLNSSLCMWWRTKFPNGAEIHFLMSAVAFNWNSTDPLNATRDQKIRAAKWLGKALVNVCMEQKGKKPVYTNP